MPLKGLQIDVQGTLGTPKTSHTAEQRPQQIDLAISCLVRLGCPGIAGVAPNHVELAMCIAFNRNKARQARGSSRQRTPPR
jgi:hypothetical protein